MDTLMSIGQLSARMGVSIRTIRHYEEMGILLPYRTSEANYRYYREKEKERLRTILLLKQMGLSLQDIKTALQEKDAGSFRRLMEARQAELSREMEELECKQSLIHEVLSHLEDDPLAAIQAAAGVLLPAIGNAYQTPPVQIIGIGNQVGNTLHRLSACQDRLGILHLHEDELPSADSKKVRSIRLPQGLDSTQKESIYEQAVREEMHRIAPIITGGELLFIVADVQEAPCYPAITFLAMEARKLGLLTVGIVAGSGCGQPRGNSSAAASILDRLDMLLEIPLHVCGNLEHAVSEAKEHFIERAVRCLSSLILSAYIDLSDIKLLVKEKGQACIGIGEASGADRISKVLNQVLNSPALYKDLSGAANLVITITGPPDLTVPEVDELVHAIKDKAYPGANIVFGTFIDDSKDRRHELTVTLIANGYGAAWDEYDKGNPYFKMKPIPKRVTPPV